MACINRNKLRSRCEGMMSMPTIKAWIEDGHAVCKSRTEWRANKISITCKSARPPYKALCKSTSHLRVVKFCAARYQLASLFYFALCRKQSSQKSESQKRLFGVPGEVLIDFVLKPVFDTANEFATGMGDVAAMMHLKRTSKTATSVSTFKEWEE